MHMHTHVMYTHTHTHTLDTHAKHHRSNRTERSDALCIKALGLWSWTRNYHHWQGDTQASEYIIISVISSVVADKILIIKPLNAVKSLGTPLIGEVILQSTTPLILRVTGVYWNWLHPILAYFHGTPYYVILPYYVHSSTVANCHSCMQTTISNYYQACRITCKFHITIIYSASSATAKWWHVTHTEWDFP